MRKLTDKQARFVVEYQVDMNATQAAIRAKYSPKTAEVIGHELLKKTLVSEAIEREIKTRLRKIGIHLEKVLTRRAQLGFSDIRRLYRPDGTLLSPPEWPDDVAPAVAGVEIFEEYQGKGEERKFIGHTKKLKMWDPNPSLTSIEKYLGIFPPEKKDGDEGIPKEFNITNLELSAKLVLLVTLMTQKQKELEEAQSKLLPNKS